MILAVNYYIGDYKIVIFYIYHSFYLLAGIFLLKKSIVSHSFFKVLFSGEWYLETEYWVHMCSFLLGITASRPLLLRESGNIQFSKNEFKVIPPIYIQHHRVLPYLSPFHTCISLFHGKNTSSQHQYINLPYPNTHAKQFQN